LTPKKEFEEAVKRDVQARVREGVKAVLEEVLQEEMTEHLGADYWELTPTRRGERNGHYTRNLVTRRQDQASGGPARSPRLRGVTP